MPQSDDDPAPAPRKLTPDDAAAYIVGEATPEQTDLMRAALLDPHAEVHEWLRDVAAWSREAFRKVEEGRLISGDEILPRARARLEVVLDFLRQKRHANVLTDDEVSKIVAPGKVGLDLNAPVLGFAECTALMHRITKGIRRHRPDLAAELDAWTGERGR